LCHHNLRGIIGNAYGHIDFFLLMLIKLAWTSGAPSREAPATSQSQLFGAKRLGADLDTSYRMADGASLVQATLLEVNPELEGAEEGVNRCLEVGYF
jgi:hypothetical protein